MIIYNYYLEDLKGKDIAVHKAGFGHAEAEEAAMLGGSFRRRSWLGLGYGIGGFGLEGDDGRFLIGRQFFWNNLGVLLGK